MMVIYLIISNQAALKTNFGRQRREARSSIEQTAVTAWVVATAGREA